MSSNDNNAEHSVHLQLQQSDDQQPLIDQPSELRSSVDEDSVDSASTSDSLLRRAFLLVWESGIACIAVASVCSSLGALCVKVLNGRVPVFEIVMVRSMLSWAATDILARAKHIEPLYGHQKHYPILAVRGFTGAAAMTLYYEAFERLELSEGMTLYFMYPAITVVMAYLFLGEKATWMSVAGCGISLIGVAFIARPPFLFGDSVSHNSDHWIGVAAAFGSAVNAAAALTAVRSIQKKETSLTVALWFHGLAVVAAILPLSFGYPSPAVAPTLKEWGLLLAIACNSFVNQIALNRGFQLELAVRASAVNYTQVFWAHIWGISFLHEHETWTGVMGSLFLLGGVLTVSSSKAKPAEIGPDDTTAFVTSIESKAADFEDTRITLGDGMSEQREWQQPTDAVDSDTHDIEMTTEPKHQTPLSKS